MVIEDQYYTLIIHVGSSIFLFNQDLRSQFSRRRRAHAEFIVTDTRVLTIILDFTIFTAYYCPVRDVDADSYYGVFIILYICILLDRY